MRKDSFRTPLFSFRFFEREKRGGRVCGIATRRSENSIQYRFSTGGHTGMLIPVYFYGTGAGRIAGIVDDTKRSQRIFALLNLPRN